MPRIVDHAARRQEIVLGLWGVIHEQGLDNVSFRAVAAAAGISIGRIQHYFTTKDELIREGCAQIVAAAGTGHDQRAVGAAPADELQLLVAAPIPTTRASRLGAAVWYAYLAKSVSDQALGEIVVGAVDDARSRAVNLLRAARRGHHADGTIEAEALALLALGDGLAQRVVVGALDSNEALAVLAEEFDRRGLARTS